jgi:hypothetical protein
MKYVTIFLLVGTIVTGCSKSSPQTAAAAPEPPVPSATPAGYPTLVVDEQHRIRGSNMPPDYQIVTASGVRLDAANFNFTYGTNALTPNMVMVVLGRSAYKLSVPRETNLYVIDGTTLTPLRGGPFRGFQPGDHAIVAIGRATNNAAGKEDLWVSWVAQISAK